MFVDIRIQNPTPNQIESYTVEDNIIKYIRNLFRLEKKNNNAIKDKIIRDIRILFESKGEGYYEPIINSNYLFVF